MEPSNAKLIKRMGIEIVDKINTLYADKPQCTVLKLNKVLDIQEAIVGGRTDKQARSSLVIRPRVQLDQSHKYTVAIETVPGEAHFYATCIVTNGYIQVLDNIDRLNRYNNQSQCVKERPLKLYCFCKDQV